MLDESVSHKIAKHLAAEHGLDVLAFHTVAEFGAPDFDVRATAKRLNRVLITLDSDFSALANLIKPPPPGIIWVHPLRRKGKLKEEKQMLDRFFTRDADGIDWSIRSSKYESSTQSSFTPKPRSSHFRQNPPSEFIT